MSLVELARDWIDTPFHPHARLKGVGVDCAGLVLSCLEDAGYVEQGRITQWIYTPTTDEGPALLADLIRATTPGVSLIKVKTIQPSDLLMFRLGNRLRHISIASSNIEHIHCDLQKVTETAISPAWLERLVVIYRVVLL